MKVNPNEMTADGRIPCACGDDDANWNRAGDAYSRYCCDVCWSSDPRNAERVERDVLRSRIR